MIARADVAKLAFDAKLLDAAQFMTFVKVFGADRILFGTDSPWSQQKISRDFVENLPLDDVDKSKILGDNAQRLLEV